MVWVASVEIPMPRLLGMGLLIAATPGAPPVSLEPHVATARSGPDGHAWNQALKTLRKAYGEAEEARGSGCHPGEAIPDLLFEF